VPDDARDCPDCHAPMVELPPEVTEVADDQTTLASSRHVNYGWVVICGSHGKNEGADEL